MARLGLAQGGVKSELVQRIFQHYQAYYFNLILFILWDLGGLGISSISSRGSFHDLIHNNNNKGGYFIGTLRVKSSEMGTLMIGTLMIGISPI